MRFIFYSKIEVKDDVNIVVPLKYFHNGKAFAAILRKTPKNIYILNYKGSLNKIKSNIVIDNLFHLPDDRTKEDDLITLSEGTILCFKPNKNFYLRLCSVEKSSKILKVIPHNHNPYKEHVVFLVNGNTVCLLSLSSKKPLMRIDLKCRPLICDYLISKPSEEYLVYSEGKNKVEVLYYGCNDRCEDKEEKKSKCEELNEEELSFDMVKRNSSIINDRFEEYKYNVNKRQLEKIESDLNPGFHLQEIDREVSLSILSHRESNMTSDSIEVQEISQLDSSETLSLKSLDKNSHGSQERETKKIEFPIVGIIIAIKLIRIYSKCFFAVSVNKSPKEKFIQVWNCMDNSKFISQISLGSHSVTKLDIVLLDRSSFLDQEVYLVGNHLGYLKIWKLPDLQVSNIVSSEDLFNNMSLSAFSRSSTLNVIITNSSIKKNKSSFKIWVQGYGFNVD